MRAKCLAALLLSVALFGCGSKEANGPSVALNDLYPIADKYSVDVTAWCLDYTGDPAVPYQQCITYFVQSFVWDLDVYYTVQANVMLARDCFLDAQGNYGLIQPANYTRCLELKPIEDEAKRHGSSHVN